MNEYKLLLLYSAKIILRFGDFVLCILDWQSRILWAVIVAWAPIENYRHDGGPDMQQPSKFLFF